MMISLKFVRILIYFLLTFSQHAIAQFGAMGYYPYGYNGLSGIFNGGGGMFPGGQTGGYPSYGGSYYPQYPMYGNYLCYQSIYCGGVYPSYGGYPYYGNSLSKLIWPLCI